MIGPFFRRTYSLLSLLILGVLAAHHPVAAQDLTISRSLVEDPGGRLNVGDLERLAGRPIGAQVRLAGTEGAYWVRLRIHAPAQGRRAVIYLRPGNLSEVLLFEPDASRPGEWKTRVTGSLGPDASQERPRGSLGFSVDVTTPEETFYLRLRSRNLIVMQVRSLEPEDAAREDHRRDLWMVFFVTFMGLLLLWAILSYIQERRPVAGCFALHQAVYTLFGLAVAGYLSLPNSPWLSRTIDDAGALLYLGINFTCAIFCREFLKPYGPPPLARRVLDALPWSFPILLAAYAAGQGPLAVVGRAVILLNAVIIKISLLCYLAAALSLRIERVPSRRVVRTFFLAIVLFNFLSWFGNRYFENLLKITLSGIPTLLFNGILFGALFAWLLHVSARQALREGHEAAMRLLLVEKQFELEQERKKQMEVQARTDYLTGLANRRHFFEQAEKEYERAVRYGRPLALLVIDIDHFKRINDTWGHAAGDRMLLHVTQLIGKMLRSNDVLARTGGEEFGVLLPETPEAEAFRVASRICSVVADARLALSPIEQVRTSVSIGLAGLGDRAPDLRALMEEADRAMYRAKQDGRNCVRAAGMEGTLMVASRHGAAD